MRATLATAAVLTSIASRVAGKTYDVKINGLAYSPNSVSGVSPGDEIRVTFSKSVTHSIVSSNYQNPCTYNAAGGVASLFYNKGEVFVFTVNSTDPQWFYCAVSGHCQAGMIFAINPSSDQSISDAQSRAANADSTSPGNAVAIGGSVAGSSSGGGSSSRGGGPSGSDSSSEDKTSQSSSATSLASSVAVSSTSSSTAASSSAGTSFAPASVATLPTSTSESAAAGAGAAATTALTSTSSSSSTASGAEPAAQTTNAAATASAIAPLAMAGALLAAAAALAI